MVFPPIIAICLHFIKRWVFLTWCNGCAQTISLGISRSASESSSLSRQQSETGVGSNSAEHGREASGVGSGLQLTTKETIERQLRELDNRIHRLASEDVTRDEIQVITMSVFTLIF